MTALLRADMLSDKNEKGKLINHAIDNAEELIPVLCDALSIDKASIRFLENNDCNIIHGYINAWKLLPMAKNKNLVLEAGVNTNILLVAIEPSDEDDPIFLGVEYLRERISLLGFDAAILGNKINLHNVDDMIKDIVRYIPPSVMEENGLATIVHQLAGGYGWNKIAKLTKWYEISGSRIDGVRLIGLSWRDGNERAEETVEMDGRTFKFTELVNGKEILQEAVEMEHCVGGYIASAYSGRCFIIRCEEIDGSARGTLELVYDSQGYELRQFQGHRNGQMDETAYKAACLFLSKADAILAPTTEEESKIRYEEAHQIRQNAGDGCNVWAYCLENNVLPYDIDYTDFLENQTDEIKMRIG